MHVIRIRLQKLVYKDVEWESIPISKEHIVAFQVRFIFHTIHDHTVSTPTLKEFFKHVTIIQEKSISVKKKPCREQGFLRSVPCDQDSEFGLGQTKCHCLVTSGNQLT